MGTPLFVDGRISVAGSQSIDRSPKSDVYDRIEQDLITKMKGVKQSIDWNKEIAMQFGNILKKVKRIFDTSEKIHQKNNSSDDSYSFFQIGKSQSIVHLQKKIKILNLSDQIHMKNINFQLH